jgi:hypothetical protein
MGRFLFGDLANLQLNFYIDSAEKPIMAKREVAN